MFFKHYTTYMLYNVNTSPGKQSSPGASSGEYKVKTGSSTTSAPLVISEDEVIFAHSNKDAALAKDMTVGAHGNELNVVFSNTLKTLRNRTNQKPAGTPCDDSSTYDEASESCQPPDLEPIIVQDDKVMNDTDQRIDSEFTSHEPSSVPTYLIDEETFPAIPNSITFAEEKDFPITEIETKPGIEQEEDMSTFDKLDFPDVEDAGSELPSLTSDQSNVMVMDESRIQQQKEQSIGQDDLELLSVKETMATVEEYSSTPYFSTYQEEDSNPISSTPPSPATIIEMRPEEFAAEASMTMLTFAQDPASSSNFDSTDSSEEDEPTLSSLPLSLYNKNTSLSSNPERRDISSIAEEESLDSSEPPKGLPWKELDITHAVIPTGGGLSINEPLDLDKGQQIDQVCKKETYYKEKLTNKSTSSKVAKSSEMIETFFAFDYVQQPKDENECNSASASLLCAAADVDYLPIQQEEVKSILPSRLEEDVLDSSSLEKVAETRGSYQQGESDILQDKLEVER